MSIIRKIKILNFFKTKEGFYCNLCSYPLLSKEDFGVLDLTSHKVNYKNDNYNCCQSCYLEFVECRKLEWKNGWRPEKSSLDSYILLRKNTNKKEIR